jgi:hypothetical protein
MTGSRADPRALTVPLTRAPLWGLRVRFSRVGAYWILMLTTCKDGKETSNIGGRWRRQEADGTAEGSQGSRGSKTAK